MALTDSIFFDNDRMICATFKWVGSDWEGDMKRMSENPKVREWWAMTDRMQVCSFRLFLTVLKMLTLRRRVLSPVL